MRRADCELVDTWLDDWVAGRLPADMARRIEAHIGECGRCHQLEAIVRGAVAETDWPTKADADAGNLIDAVMSKTSGNGCAQAEVLLPALVDGQLDSVSSDIVSAHLEHCGGCAQLAAVLREAREVLPTLAEIEPPPGFTTRVLARTSRAERRSALSEWCVRILARPRASMELAYIGAILIVVLVGNPVMAFRGAEARARRLVGSVPVERITGELPPKAAAVGVVASAVGSLIAQVRAIGVELSNSWLHAKAMVDGAWDDVVRAANWVRTLGWKDLLKAAAPTPGPDNKAPPAKRAK
ncbi:MAG: zf-HC2 domain-containing protein [Bacteroidales bacterium]